MGLAQGDHLIQVTEPGWAAWGMTVAVNGPTLEIQVPPRRGLTLTDTAAAARARRMGASFALVAEPRPGRDGGLSVALRLVDATGRRLDAVIAPLAGDPTALDAAVMRLDEQARRLDRAGPTANAPAGAAPNPTNATNPTPAPSALPPAVWMTPPPTRARFADDPGAWARDHWPLLTAVGVMLGATLVLSVTVMN
ncbi:MAG: hypothetical protein H7X95_05785 [Deltaproteobacteria bacterium]|nr:hypothetical protein [Deltaproteobacteria bacterium]